jgi:mannose-6-phosphate isomerase-like protein (cupin superfamily)
MMPTFNEDILKLVRENTHFLEEIVTNEFTQVALMSIETGNDIGEEVHEADQVMVVVQGSGEVVLNRQHSPVQADSLVVVPAGTRHNVINTGSVPLKLYTLFAPPAGAPGTVYQTKGQAMAAEAAAEEAAAELDRESRIASVAVDRSNGRSK